MESCGEVGEPSNPLRAHPRALRKLREYRSDTCTRHLLSPSATPQAFRRARLQLTRGVGCAQSYDSLLPLWLCPGCPCRCNALAVLGTPHPCLKQCFS